MSKDKKPHNDDSEIDLGIIITPMLDMSFQLLAFFIMTYQTPSYEVGINIKLMPPEQILVKNKNNAAIKKEEKPKQSFDLEIIKDAVLVSVKAYYPEKEAGKNADARQKAGKIQDGMPLAIFIKTPEGIELKEVANEADSVKDGWKKMLTQLKDIRKTLGPPPSKDNKEQTVKTIIKLMPDAGLKHRYVLQAWDICREAGFETIGFVPPPDMPESSALSFKKGEKD